MGDTNRMMLTADAVLPMTGRDAALLERAGVVVEGNRIVAVGRVGELREKFGALQETYTPGVMLPGFINAHTHLELGYQRAGMERPGYFTEWVTGLMRNYPAAEEVEAAVTGAVRAGVAESLRAGVTTVGDISRHCRVTRGVLAGLPLRVVSFGEVIGLGKMRERRTEYLEAAASGAFRTGRLTVGLSPHAPYTVEGPTLREVVERGVRDGLPMTMHLAELAEEEAFLRDGTGRLGEWGLMRNLVDARVPRCEGGALRWAEAYGLLGAAREVPVVLAHVNYASDEDIALLARSEASVVYCPRTRTYFGHDDVGEHRYREMLRRGVNVCLGTDSLASNPDLNVVKEAASLHARDGVAAYEALEMITVRGALALGVAAGELSEGRLADVVVLDARVGASVEETLAGILSARSAAKGVWIDGVWALG